AAVQIVTSGRTVWVVVRRHLLNRGDVFYAGLGIIAKTSFVFAVALRIRITGSVQSVVRSANKPLIAGAFRVVRRKPRKRLSIAKHVVPQIMRPGGVATVAVDDYHLISGVVVHVAQLRMRGRLADARRVAAHASTIWRKSYGFVTCVTRQWPPEVICRSALSVLSVLPSALSEACACPVAGDAKVVVC
ncbi:hypothetical protein TcCL_NonESM05616, partial [Trypanosoma cruzi]